MTCGSAAHVGGLRVFDTGRHGPVHRIELTVEGTSPFWGPSVADRRRLDAIQEEENKSTGISDEHLVRSFGCSAYPKGTYRQLVDASSGICSKHHAVICLQHFMGLLCGGVPVSELPKARPKDSGDSLSATRINVRLQ